MMLQLQRGVQKQLFPQQRCNIAALKLVFDVWLQTDFCCRNAQRKRYHPPKLSARLLFVGTSSVASVGQNFVSKLFNQDLLRSKILQFYLFSRLFKCIMIREKVELYLKVSFHKNAMMS